MVDRRIERNPNVTVSHGRTVLWVPAGEIVSFGRGSFCKLQLPQDDFISRHAGDLEVRPTGVIVWNRSSLKPLVVRPFAGGDVLVEPGEGHAPSPQHVDVFDIVLTGKGDLVAAVHVDTRRLHRDTPDQRPSAAARTGQANTYRAEIRWKPHQHRVLVALCEPVFTRRGKEAVPATYQQVADRLGLSPAYVRNVVRAIRETLTGLGLSGLTADDEGPTDDLRTPLTQSARRYGWVTLEDVLALDVDSDQHRSMDAHQGEPEHINRHSSEVTRETGR